MKVPWQAHTVRLNCTIRVDVKALIQEIAAKWHRQEGGYVAEGRVVGEAVALLAKREGIELKPADPPEEPARQPRRPSRSAPRRNKRSAVA
jgi:hypothetical protein